MRLNKFIAQAGIASRRKADELIQSGSVTVNGAPAEVGQQIDPENDHVKVDDKLISGEEEKVYLLLNKPPGVLSTSQDDKGRTTVLDLVKPYNTLRIYPVGRLDYSTEGLIILTNDGDFAAKVGHPSSGPSKTYEVRVRGVPDEKDLELLRTGMRIDNYTTRPALVKLLKSRKNAWVEITIKEGRNRQIRKMFEAIRHPVVKLRRVRIGFLSSSAMDKGEYRLLRESEIAKLMKSKSRTSKKSQK